MGRYKLLQKHSDSQDLLNNSYYPENNVYVKTGLESTPTEAEASC